MNERAFAAVFVVAIWWLSTGVVLGVVWLRPPTFRLSLVAFSALALFGLVGLEQSSRFTSAAAAYIAFGCALMVWAWHELTFLLGMITGPRKVSCTPGAKGWQRFVCATSTVIHHELALALTAMIVVALTWRGPNQVGAYTFLVLWVMRLSAKLNVFLGVRNLTEQFVPEHLRYLLSYFRRARMNPLMPISILAGGAVALQLLAGSLSADATAFTVIGKILVATILGLAVLEHLFLMLPVPDALLWRWAIRRPRQTQLRAEEGNRGPMSGSMMAAGEALGEVPVGAP
jgi:putative photosynthetic complex assembly protein 2